MKAVIKQDFDTLLEALKTGAAYFVYEKKDGSVREAKGTLSENIIPDVAKRNASKMHALLTQMLELRAANRALAFALSEEPGSKEKQSESIELSQLDAQLHSEAQQLVENMKAKSPQKDPNPDLQWYWDLDENNWRCFVKSNFLGIIVLERLS